MSTASLNFLYPLPFTPLLIAEGSNQLVVRLEVPDGTPVKGQTIHWLAVADSALVQLTAQQTQTLEDGTSTNSIEILGSLPDLLTISVWSDLDPRHFSTLYECVKLRSWVSMKSSIGQLYPRGSNERPKEAQQIGVTTTLLDETSRPVRGLRCHWGGSPNPPTSAWEPIAGGLLVPLVPDKDGYPFETNSQGRATISFSNAATTICQLNLNVNNVAQDSRPAVFTNIENGNGDLPPIIFDFDNDGRVDLDKYDDKGVAAYLPTSIGSGYYVAIWLNEEIVARGTPEYDYSVTPLYIKKSYFQTDGANNTAGYIISSPAGNGKDSKLRVFPVIGTIPAPQPPVVTRTYDQPSIVPPIWTVVNASTVAGGLELSIPPYTGIADGDKVTINIYLEGYLGGTNVKKYGFVTMEHDVADGDVDNGFTVVADESNFVGYYRSTPGNAYGKFRAEYVVNGTQYSELLVLPFADPGP